MGKALRGPEMTKETRARLWRVAEAMKLRKANWGYVEALHEAASVEGVSATEAIYVAEVVCFGDHQHMGGKL